jgi:hypothetical protein
MSTLTTDQVWEKFAAQVPGLLERRPDFRFDPDYYAAQVGLADLLPSELEAHFHSIGRYQGLSPTRFMEARKHNASVDDVVRDLIIDDDILSVLDAEDGVHLGCEIIGLGVPFDEKVSHFSKDEYCKYPDVVSAQVDPLMHYLAWGVKEGRVTLKYARENFFSGHIPFDQQKPSCVICVHEMTRTGAPVVGLEISADALKNYNVILMSLKSGPMLEEFRKFSSLVIVSQSPINDSFMINSDYLKNVEFAILNSVASWPFMPFLIQRNIPFASYVHEYWELMRGSAYHAIPTFSDLVIFSSETVRDHWRGRMLDMMFDVERDSCVIPQRSLTLGGVSAARQAEAREKISKVLGRDLGDATLVCGAGHPEWRKGTDIFAMASQIAKSENQNLIFAWIGANIVRDEILFGAYIDHHLSSIDCNNPESNFFFIQSGPIYKDLMAACDVFFMSSRFDPLPNVVFDAVAHGCNIVHFNGATGFDDDIYQASGRFFSVDYGNPKAAADVIAAVGRKACHNGATIVQSECLFARIESALRSRLEAQRYFVSGVQDPSHPIIFYGPESGAKAGRLLEAEKMFRYDRRRVWRDLRDVEDHLTDSTNWVHRMTRIAPYEAADHDPSVSFSVHIHAHYIDTLSNDLRNYCLLRKAKRIIVTRDSDEKASEIKKICLRFGLYPEVIIVPNVGRDILPFLQLFQHDGVAGDDEFWCHIHQKKSLASTTGGDKWKRFLLRILFGDTDEISPCLAHLAKDGVGLVAPLVPNHCGWDESRRLLPKFSDGLPGELPENPLLFPIGNMFWVRNSVARRMYDHFGPDYQWPGEPIGIDGTEYHLIERLWPTMAASLGLESVFVHKLDEKRT